MKVPLVGSCIKGPRVEITSFSGPPSSLHILVQDVEMEGSPRILGSGATILLFSPELLGSASHRPGHCCFVPAFSFR